ncbi:MAG: hypothetical protein MJ238_07575 [Bacilli bacterium]|nr:hypothetical protein [Bacilli bacterium]
MKRTNDEMIFILSEYAASHPDEIQTFDDLTPFINEHPEIFGDKNEEDDPSYKEFLEGESTMDEELAKEHFRKAIDLNPLNFDARSELLALESSNSSEFAAGGLAIQTKGMEFFMSNPKYKNKIGNFFDETTTASFLRFTKSLMEQFYMAGEYDVVVSLGKEMMTLDIKDTYKARRLLFKALVGLGDDRETRTFIDNYRFEKDSYFYSTLGLLYIKEGKLRDAYDLFMDDYKVPNRYIADCICFANDYELREESEKQIDTFFDEIAYEGSPREALNYTDEAIPFDAEILQKFQDANLSDYLDSLGLSFEASVALLTVCDIAIGGKTNKVPLGFIKAIFKGEVLSKDEKVFSALPGFGEIKEEEKIARVLRDLSVRGLIERKGSSYIIKHEAFTAFMALCRVTEIEGKNRSQA